MPVCPNTELPVDAVSGCILKRSISPKDQLSSSLSSSFALQEQTVARRSAQRMPPACCSSARFPQELYVCYLYVLRT